MQARCQEFSLGDILVWGLSTVFRGFGSKNLITSRRIFRPMRDIYRCIPSSVPGSLFSSTGINVLHEN